jgi:hypothetical protein
MNRYENTAKKREFCLKMDANFVSGRIGNEAASRLENSRQWF